MSVASSAGSPTLRSDIISASASTNSSCRRSLTRMRVCATQACPLFIRPAIFNPATVFADIGVVENDRRRLAAEFQAHALELLAAQGGDAAADGAGTGEGDLVHAGVAHQRLADVGVRPAAPTPRPPGKPICSIISANHKASKGVSGAGLMMTVQPAINAGISLGMIKNCGTFHGTIAADHADRGPAEVYFAEHALAPFRPGEVARGGQREMHQRRRGRRLAQPAETARGPHFVGDQVGHLLDVVAVDRGELFNLGHPLGVGQSVATGHGRKRVARRRPRRRRPRARQLDVADRLFGCGEITASWLGLAGLRHCPPMNSSS